ncbi:MAG: polynucleotide adenylyltransferase, partial [Oscillospiraceae bacterium]|nr:polynucleotide adenylyltransferase [Oscillospiraceae bacterium]
MISPPEFAVSVLDTLSAAGFSAYFVGGCVRDTMMSRRVSDWDAAASALPHEVMALFRKTAPTGIRYGTVTVFCGENKVEVTSFRQEAGYDGRRPAAVRFGADISRDLSRRDFTVNAMAMGARGGIIDPFGGMADIERRLIRAVGAPSVRFCEDALRMLRALRFSAQLGFAIERETRAAIRECAHLARA